MVLPVITALPVSVHSPSTLTKSPLPPAPSILRLPPIVSLPPDATVIKGALFVVFLIRLPPEEWETKVISLPAGMLMGLVTAMSPLMVMVVGEPPAPVMAFCNSDKVSTVESANGTISDPAKGTTTASLGSSCLGAASSRPSSSVPGLSPSSR